MNYLAYFAHQLAPLIPFALGWWMGRGNERDKQKRALKHVAEDIRALSDEDE